MHDPAWWALGVAVIGTAVNGFFNWKNWQKNIGLRYEFTVEQPRGVLARNVFHLRNTGRKVVTGIRLGVADPIDGIVGRGRRVPVVIDDRRDLRPREFLTFEVGVCSPQFHGEWQWLVPKRVEVWCDQSKKPFIVDMV